MVSQCPIFGWVLTKFITIILIMAPNVPQTKAVSDVS
jgi:hypothetical protein